MQKHREKENFTPRILGKEKMLSVQFQYVKIKGTQ